MNDLGKLRISLARVAQSLNVETDALPVLGKAYEELCDLAQIHNRGWNELAAACADKAQALVPAREETYQGLPYENDPSAWP